jgi:hypothetical protein
LIKKHAGQRCDIDAFLLPIDDVERAGELVSVIERFSRLQSGSMDPGECLDGGSAKML